MKRLLWIPLLLCLLIGCSPKEQKPTQPPAITGFSCNAAGTYRGGEVAGTLQRTAAGLLTASLTKPAELDGLTMEWNGEAVTLRMMGLSWSVSPDKVPEAALGKRILDVLDAVVYGNGNGERTEDGRLATTGDAGNGAVFTLYSDPETGELLALEVPSEELSLTFSNFQRL